ncbi:hypothetical protein [Streptomyces sp. NPDC001970]
MFFAKKVAVLVGHAREHGVAAEPAEGAQVHDELLGTGVGAPPRSAVPERIEVAMDAQAERYGELSALVRGEQPRPSMTSDHQWPAGALRAHG